MVLESSIVITIEFSRLGAGKLFYNNQLYFPSREFLTLKGIILAPKTP